jgi:hypothetical protein
MRGRASECSILPRWGIMPRGSPPLHRFRYLLNRYHQAHIRAVMVQFLRKEGEENVDVSLAWAAPIGPHKRPHWP